MQDVSTLGRITSGVKLMDLVDGVKIAKIAKVREKISDGEQEFDNVEEALKENNSSETAEEALEDGISEENTSEDE